MTSGKAMGMRGMCLVYRMTAAKVSRKRSVVPPYEKMNVKQKHLTIPVYTQNSNSPCLHTKLKLAFSGCCL